MMSFNTFASLFLVVCCFRYPYKDADKQATLTGWGILIATWFVSRFVASPLVRDPKCGMSQNVVSTDREHVVSEHRHLCLQGVPVHNFLSPTKTWSATSCVFACCATQGSWHRRMCSTQSMLVQMGISNSISSC